MTGTVDCFAPQHSPTIFNASKHSMVVFQERGTLYNRQVLKPGEAISMTKKQTGGIVLPYRVHAVVGDEQSLPTSRDSQKNLVKVTVIPAAFVAGCFATAISAGMLVGPSAALAPLVSGMVVQGVVVDAAALAAGGIMATRAQAVTDMLLKQKPDIFMAKTERLRPGQRYLVVTGGLDDGSIKIQEVTHKKFEKKFTVTNWKQPLSNKSSSSKQDGVQYCLPDSTEDQDMLVDEERDEVAKINV